MCMYMCIRVNIYLCMCVRVCVYICMYVYSALWGCVQEYRRRKEVGEHTIGYSGTHTHTSQLSEVCDDAENVEKRERRTLLGTVVYIYTHTSLNSLKYVMMRRMWRRWQRMR